MALPDIDFGWERRALVLDLKSLVRKIHIKKATEKTRRYAIGNPIPYTCSALSIFFGHVFFVATAVYELFRPKNYSRS